LDAETASTCKGAVDSWVAEWNQSRLPGQAKYKTVPLYRHAQPAPVCVPLGNSPYDVPHSMPSNLRELIAEEIGILFSDDDAQSVWDVCRRAAMLQAGNSPVIPDGWKMVPVEPNGDMLAAAQDAFGETDGDIASTLRAAIVAAPQEVK
ncbi:hypothetical protein KVP24_26280, partial [Klebsiella aerogenes]|nr:hypothetical protein [Klebsiella aerogenes]MBV6285390.1 hypothetical protein [Klebsiella aerogenes]